MCSLLTVAYILLRFFPKIHFSFNQQEAYMHGLADKVNVICQKIY